MRADPGFIRLIMGLRKPKFPVLGADVSGLVEAVGSKVTRFSVGDEVFGESGNSGWGGFAEYVTVEESHLVSKPAGVSHEVAAATPLACVTAMQGMVTHGGVQKGEHVLVNGASGGVGHFAVQIAKHLGARVTATCSSEKVEMVRSLSPDRVIDYREEDVTQSGETYDVIFESALFRPINDYKPVLKPEGRFLYVGGASSGFIPNLLLNLFAKPLGRVPVINYTAKTSTDDLKTIADWLDAGVIVPHIDRILALEQVAEGIRHMESRKVIGKIVVKI